MLLDLYRGVISKKNYFEFLGSNRESLEFFVKIFRKIYNLINHSLNVRSPTKNIFSQKNRAISSKKKLFKFRNLNQKFEKAAKISWVRRGLITKIDRENSRNLKYKVKVRR